MNLPTILLISACLLPATTILAQDLPSIEFSEKKYHNMDSELARLYEAATRTSLEKSDTPALQSQEEQVQVVLEMAGIGAPIPENLGIQVETTYENLVQATVPIKNLEAIASDENVNLIRMPHMPTPMMTQIIQDGFNLAYLLAIPAIAAPIIAGVLIYQRRSSR